MDHSHGSAERSRSSREICLVWDKDSHHLGLFCLTTYSVDCHINSPKQQILALMERWWKKQTRQRKGSFRASKNPLWRACWCLAANTLKAYLHSKRGLRPPWCWFSNRVAANSAPWERQNGKKTLKRTNPLETEGLLVHMLLCCEFYVCL